jgi:hypothetical protein
MLAAASAVVQWVTMPTATEVVVGGIEVELIIMLWSLIIVVVVQNNHFQQIIMPFLSIFSMKLLPLPFPHFFLCLFDYIN